MGSMLHPLFVLPFALGAAAGPAFGAADVLVKLPCGAAPFRTCPDLRSRLVEGTKDLPGFRGIVTELLDGLYRGKVKIDGRDVVMGAPPVCLPLKIPEHGCKDEFQVNANGEACPAISKVGFITPDKPIYSLGKLRTGTLETSHIASGMALGVSSVAGAVEKEIAANALKIAGASGCNAKAAALKREIDSQDSVKLLAQVPACDVSNTSSCSTKNYFAPNLLTLETLYLQLARCRVIEESAAGSRQLALNYVSRIENEVLRNPCMPIARGNASRLKECYAREYARWIRQRAKNEFPGLGGVCGN